MRTTDALSCAAEDDTMVKTTSRSASSEMEPATDAPSAASGSALDRVLFQTSTSTPARARRRAMAAPIRPVPIQLTRAAPEVAPVMVSSVCSVGVYRERAGALLAPIPVAIDCET
jgi:hypothetical protein